MRVIVQQTIETHILIVNRWAASFGVDATRRRALFATENISHLELGENDFLSSAAKKIKTSTRLEDSRNSRNTLFVLSPYRNSNILRYFMVFTLRRRGEVKLQEL